jgi:choloylglycine hydrolase
MKKYVFSLIGIAIQVVCLHSHACTGIKLVAKDGAFVHGRTLEFGVQVEIAAAVIPRGLAFKGTTPNGDGLTYTSKYGVVGCMAFGVPSLMDGLNEKGLAVGTFYFPTFAGYSTITADNQAKALSPVEFPNWILTQFATIEEVKQALNQVVIAPTVVKAWGNEAPPFHYIVFDKTGKGLVIEPLAGKLVTHETTLGTFTNSPTFDWHMTNLRNYINLTPFNVKPVTLDGLTLKPFGAGSGMVGLPGDFTPPSRFVRAAIFSATAVPSANAEAAIFQAFHILNQFDIPVGTARDKIGDVVYTDYTQLTCARDPQALKYYFRSYDDPSIKVIDLHQADLDAKTMKTLSAAGKNQAINVTAQLK